MTVGLPGTGISYSTKLGGGTPRRTSAAPQLVQAPAAQIQAIPGTAQQQVAANSGEGCLKVFGVLLLLGILVANPVVGVVVGIMAIGGWIFVGRKIKRGREIQERERLAGELRRFEAHQEEHRKAIAEQDAYQQRQYAEQQRILALEAAENARIEQERQQRLEAQRLDEERIRRERWEGFVAKYGEPLAHKLWAGRPWVGCQHQMIIDMLGRPADIDEKVLKTKTKHTYKYRPLGGNRYGLRIYLDNGVVTGWEDKSD